MSNDKARILTVSELSEYLHVHRTTIYRMLREGKLPGFRIGSDWRFSLEAIEQWLRDEIKTDIEGRGVDSPQGRPCSLPKSVKRGRARDGLRGSPGCETPGTIAQNG
jgi:excisionase family DNA binding protein